MKKPWELTVDDLSDLQKQNLGYKLEKKGLCGLVTAYKIMNGNALPGKTLFDIFTTLGCNERSAKIHARKVFMYSLTEKGREAARLGL